MEVDPVITIKVFPAKLIKPEKNNFVNISQDKHEKDPLEMEMEEFPHNYDDGKELDFEEAEVNKKVSLAREGPTTLKYDPDSNDVELEVDMDAGMEDIQNILKIEIPTEDMDDVTTKLRDEAVPPVKIPKFKLSSSAAVKYVVGASCVLL